MTLTTNINIGGCAFTIDQDAYTILEQYLDSITSHLQASDSKEEIMQDIELRIAELFSEHLKFSHMEVVNLSMVNDIKRQLGSPETISGEQEQTTDEKGMDDDILELEAEEVPHAESDRINMKANKKKLYRDIDNQKMGGVCAGLGKYFGIDSIWLRLIFAVAFLFYGSGLMAYLLLWIVMPAANTSARRLEMEGIEPTAENIQQEVERQQAEGKNDKSKQSENKGCLTGGLIIIGLLLLSPFIIAFGGVLVGLVATLGGLAVALPSIGTSMLGWGSGINSFIAICFILALLIPIVTIIIWAVRRNKKEQTPAYVWIIATLLWIASIIGGSIACVHVAKDYIKDNSSWEWSWSSIRNDETGEIDEEALSDSIEVIVNNIINQVAAIEEQAEALEQKAE